MSKFKKLKGYLESKGYSPAYAAGVTASAMLKKFKKSDIVKHQQSGTSMENVKPKKGHR